MNEANIEHVQTDLATLRGAMDLDLPFDEWDIWLTLGCSASLLPPIAFGLMEKLEGMGRLSFLPFLILGAAAMIRAIYRSFSRRTNASMKKSDRFSLLLVIVIVPSAIALKKWGFAAGVPDMAVVTVVGVSVGLLCCMIPYWNRNLLFNLGIGLALIAMGLAAPFCPREYSIPVLTAFIVLGCLAASVIMRLQLNRVDQECQSE